MRAPPIVLLALLALPLAGCLQGDTGSGSTTSFQATCPNWTLAQHPLAALVDTTLYQAKTPGQATRTNQETFPFAAGGRPAQPPPDQDGRKADRFLLTFPAAAGGPIQVENGTLTFRVYRNDTGEQLKLADPNQPDVGQFEATFSASGRAKLATATYLVSLVPASQDPRPAAIRLESTFTALPGFTISTGQSGTPRAGASYSVEPLVSYRAAGCVQK